MNNKKTLLIFTTTFIFSYLFFKQGLGTNLAVFTGVFILFMGINDFANFSRPKWWLATTTCIILGSTTAFNGAGINVLLNILGLLLITYVTINPKLSIITGIVYAGISAKSGFFLSCMNKLLSSLSNPKNNISKKYRTKWYYIAIPTFLLLVFILLYRQSSGAFQHLTNKIDLSFISIEWIAFTVLGLIMIYGLFSAPKELDFLKRETNYTNTEFNLRQWKTNGFLTTGLIAFISLDVLLLIVNISDILYLTFLEASNMDISYAELIHQGIESLIASLLLAVLFILIWLNQNSVNTNLYRKIKVFALIWIFLNLIMLITNIYKNTIYINTYGLTHLRIGVYFFLFASFATLVFCSIKVLNGKNNLFIYRRFGISLLCLCVIFNTFNWDKIICKNNIALYKSGKLSPDAEYLLNLSSDCLPIIVESWDSLNPNNDELLSSKLKQKCNEFITSYKNYDWRSRTYNNSITYSYIKNNY